MDPYCRVRVGVQVFETPTAYNGSKNPRWNKLMQCHVSETLQQIYLEVFDECSFSVDERVAWGKINITETAFTGETVEDWYPLSGKQGEDKEGSIHVVLKYQKFQAGVPMRPMMPIQPMVMSPMVAMQTPPIVANPGAMYGYQQFVPPNLVTPQQQQIQQQQQQIQQQQQQQQQQPPNPTDLKNLKEMVPEMDDDIIQSVLQQSGGNVERAAEQLLEMTG